MSSLDKKFKMAFNAIYDDESIQGFKVTGNKF